MATIVGTEHGDIQSGTPKNGGIPLGGDGLLLCTEGNGGAGNDCFVATAAAALFTTLLLKACMIAIFSAAGFLLL